MKKNVYIRIAESFYCTAEIKHNTVNQLYFNKIKTNKNESRYFFL